MPIGRSEGTPSPFPEWGRHPEGRFSEIDAVSVQFLTRGLIEMNDRISVLATKKATSRFNIWGEVSWAREKSDIALPQDPMLVESIEYEAAGYEQDARMTRLAAYVTTGFKTVALVRINDEGVALTVWGDSLQSVDETIAAFLKALPTREAESDGEVTAGLYL